MLLIQKLVLLSLIFRSCNSFEFQFPFQKAVQTSLSKSATDGGGSEDEVVHYSNIPESELPINLRQYSEDKVIRVFFCDDKQLQRFLLSNEFSSIEYNKWGKSNIEKFLDIQIDVNNLDKLREKFPNMNYTTVIDDLSQKIFESYPRDIKKKQLTASVAGDTTYEYQITEDIVNSTKANVFSELFFRDYRPLESIDAWLEIIGQSFPELIKLEDIGQTYEHRTYKVVHMSAPDGEIDHNEKKTIVITGGIHAREWISTSTVLYIIYELLTDYYENPESNDILKKLDFLFVPVANPDGYEYTWKSDRLWRKNRQETILPRCFGIDIDHSFDYHWTHSSDWACGEEYSGEVPFEAIESKIWYNYLNETNNDHKIYGYIDLHSYAEEILFPYAYSCNQQPRDEENLIELAYGIAKAIRRQSGKNYNVLPACIDKDADLMPDLGSGSSLDFMYHNRAFWAYQLKLRDTGSHGFLLPGKYIEPVGKEIFAGIKYFCSFLLSDD